MSIRITTNQNNVTVADADKSITIINNREPNRIDVVQPESSLIYVTAPGPQGPAGGGSADLAALNNFSASILTFTGSIQTQVNNLTAATSSYILASGSLIRLETNTQVTGSLSISAGITGSLFGTSSWANQARSASYVLSSNVIGPFGANSVNFAGSAGYASNAGTATTADTLTSFASVNQINIGELPIGNAVFTRPSELEQSKYATVNIYNYNNFT